jgi:hypothetical protein
MVIVHEPSKHRFDLGSHVFRAHGPSSIDESGNTKGEESRRAYRTHQTTWALTFGQSSLDQHCH